MRLDVRQRLEFLRTIYILLKVGRFVFPDSFVFEPRAHCYFVLDNIFYYLDLSEMSKNTVILSILIVFYDKLLILMTSLGTTQSIDS